MTHAELVLKRLAAAVKARAELRPQIEKADRRVRSAILAGHAAGIRQVELARVAKVDRSRVSQIIAEGQQ